jgi:SAM-dependent methyltransferase
MELQRRVEPEILDGLAADEPQARRSRRDLQRIHRVMRSASILRAALGRLQLPAQPIRLLELGAGDGTLLLRCAAAQQQPWRDVDLTLLDRLDCVSAETLAGYAALGWRVRVLRCDVLDWASASDSTHFDLCIANLFLHHFTAQPLAALLRRSAAVSDAFIACEPRRSRFALWASRLVLFLGANAVTRNDAVASVDAGFAGEELTALWPQTSQWRLDERLAWPFTHCFTARRIPA